MALLYMEDKFKRIEKLIGKEGMENLKRAHVAVFGLGGVGGFAAEALCRSGIYNFSLFDNDAVCPSNINRQLAALHSTLGMQKTEVMKNRMLDINPQARIYTYNCFYGKDNAQNYDLKNYTYIIDAIDTVKSKLILIERAKAADVPILSCMGAGNRLCGREFIICDIKHTSYCPLAKIMRRELRKMGIESLNVVYSREVPRIKAQKPPSSAIFATAAAGLLMAEYVVKDIAKIN